MRVRVVRVSVRVCVCVCVCVGGGLGLTINPRDDLYRLVIGARSASKRARDKQGR